MDIINNCFVGKKFKHNKKEYVVTWNDQKHLRATPLDCKTGLTSITFIIEQVVIEEG